MPSRQPQPPVPLAEMDEERRGLLARIAAFEAGSAEAFQLRAQYASWYSVSRRDGTFGTIPVWRQPPDIDAELAEFIAQPD